MNPKSKTALIIDFVELSQDYDFRDDIQCALEADYAENPGLYNLEVLSYVACVLIIATHYTPDQALDLVRNYPDISSAN